MSSVKQLWACTKVQKRGWMCSVRKPYVWKRTRKQWLLSDKLTIALGRVLRAASGRSYTPLLRSSVKKTVQRPQIIFTNEHLKCWLTWFLFAGLIMMFEWGILSVYETFTINKHRYVFWFSEQKYSCYVCVCAKFSFLEFLLLSRTIRTCENLIYILFSYVTLYMNIFYL